MTTELTKEDKDYLLHILEEVHKKKSFYNSIDGCPYYNCWYKLIIKKLGLENKEKSK